MEERDVTERTLLQMAALFMIYLTVSIIFVSALSMRADAALSAVVYGQDQVQDFRRANDTTTVFVYADSDLVSLLGNSGALNMTCQPATGGGYTCSYTFPQEYQAPRVYSLQVAQQDGTPAQITKQYTVDGVPPTFNRITYRQAGEYLIADYSVTDTSYPGDTNGCSGLGTLSLVVDDNTVATKTLNQSGCSDTGSLQADLPGRSGQVKAYLLASDRLGNTGNSTLQTLTVDTVPPSLPSTFQLLHNGVDVQRISTNSQGDIRVTLNLSIQEDALASAVADASALTTDPSLQQAYKALKLDCVQDGGLYDCTADNLKLDPANETVTINLAATDAKGNRATGVATKVLTIENTNPTITYLGRADPRCDGTCYARSGANQLLAEVNAPGGMAGAGLFVSFGGSAAAATNCSSADGTTWDCAITALLPEAPSGSTQTLTILPSSMDDLGNAFTGNLTRSFIVDNDPPKLVGTPTADLSCPTADQTLTVNATATDSVAQTLVISANVSAVTDQDAATADCTPVGNKTFTCSLPISGFVSVHTTATVPIAITDQAGNAVKMQMPLEVCEAENEATPNYITRIGLAGSAPAVDKRIASLIPFRVVLPLTMTITGGARVLQVSRVTCTNDFIVGPSYVVNDFSSAPVLVTSYQYRGAWPKKEVPLNCTLDFTIRRGNTVYSKPEQENVTASLPLVGQEIGNPGAAIKQKENGLVQDINGLQGSIDSKARLDNTIGKLCNLAETIGNINSALQAVKAVLYGIAMVLMGTVFGATAGIALWHHANIGLSNIGATVNKYIWPIGWMPTSSSAFSTQIVGYLVKWTCGLYECKMYDASTWAQIGMEVGQYENVFHMNEVPVTDTVTTSNTYYIPDFSSSNDVASWYGYTPSLSDKSVTITSTYHVQSVVSAVPGSNLYNDMLNQNKAFVDSIPGDNWIVNPYRSTEYDALCIPAQLYNLRKEKQLKCIELKCIREVAPTGVPITQCEQNYAAQSCLYLESAQAKMGSSITDILEKAVAAIALQTAIGFGIQWAFKSQCAALFSMTDPGAVLASTAGGSASTCTLIDQAGVLQWSLPYCGAKAVACGLAQSYFNFEELSSFAHSLRSQNSDVPSGQDYCAGLQGVKPDSTASSGGGLL